MARFYPLSLRLTCADEIFQLRFALEAVECLKTPGLLLGVDYEPSGEGLILFAETEEAFAPVVSYLREQHFGDLVVGPTRVRYRWRPMLLEPVMAIWIRVTDDYHHLVVCHLLSRGATVQARAPEATAYDIHATAPLTRLLGIRCELQALCDGFCHAELELFGYFSPTPYDHAG